MHQHDITRLDSRPHHQRTIARRRRHKQARGVPERPALRHRQQRHLLGAQLRRKGALRGTKDAGSHGEARLGPAFARRGHDGAGELGSGDPWEGWRSLLAIFVAKEVIQWFCKYGKLTRLVLIASLNLQDIEKVGCRGVHFNDILVVFGHGVRQLCHLELRRALQFSSKKLSANSSIPLHLGAFEIDVKIEIPMTGRKGGERKKCLLVGHLTLTYFWISMPRILGRKDER